MGRASGPVTRAVALRGHDSEPAAGRERAGGGRGERSGQVCHPAEACQRGAFRGPACSSSRRRKLSEWRVLVRACVTWIPRRQHRAIESHQSTKAHLRP